MFGSGIENDDDDDDSPVDGGAIVSECFRHRCHASAQINMSEVEKKSGWSIAVDVHTETR